MVRAPGWSLGREPEGHSAATVVTMPSSKWLSTVSVLFRLDDVAEEDVRARLELEPAFASLAAGKGSISPTRASASRPSSWTWPSSTTGLWIVAPDHHHLVGLLAALPATMFTGPP